MKIRMGEIYWSMCMSKGVRECGIHLMDCFEATIAMIGVVVMMTKWGMLKIGMASILGIDRIRWIVVGGCHRPRDGCGWNIHGEMGAECDDRSTERRWMRSWGASFPEILHLWLQFGRDGVRVCVYVYMRTSWICVRILRC